MSLAPLRPEERQPRERRLVGGNLLVRLQPTAGSLARRRWMVRLAKYLMPVLAVALLASIALWPEFSRLADQQRVIMRRLTSTENDSARVIEPHYRGVDEHDRPYTLTSATAVQDGPERVNLTDPKADITTQSGSWAMLQSQYGVFMQQTNLLDLSGDVVLYRDDGTTLHTDTATVDLKAAVAAGNDQVHAEGPFGVLDAQAFTITDGGDVIQFTGPARLHLNGAEP
jgi:lipopolysaccharide export system protein LptC